LRRKICDVSGGVVTTRAVEDPGIAIIPWQLGRG
jgi:hypothetical protein